MFYFSFFWLLQFVKQSHQNCGRWIRWYHEKEISLKSLLTKAIMSKIMTIKVLMSEQIKSYHINMLMIIHGFLCFVFCPQDILHLLTFASITCFAGLLKSEISLINEQIHFIVHCSTILQCSLLNRMTTKMREVCMGEGETLCPPQGPFPHPPLH